IYVGNLPLDIRTRDIEDLFYKYGRIRDIEVKTPNRPPAFAFVSFEDYRDAEDAIRGRDGISFEGARLRCEMSRGNGPRGSRQQPRRDLRRSDYRVIVSNLPPSASWQDLKDHFRQVGEVVYTDVDRSLKSSGGIVEFASRSEQEAAIKQLDDTEFKNPFDKVYIRVKAPKDQGSKSRSRSRSRSKSKSRSRSRSR
ncbi:hypothetical protein GUITHDRAFT_41825, partial [Guillardia theta CCMP2712]